MIETYQKRYVNCYHLKKKVWYNGHNMPTWGMSLNYSTQLQNINCRPRTAEPLYEEVVQSKMKRKTDQENED